MPLPSCISVVLYSSLVILNIIQVLLYSSYVMLELFHYDFALVEVL